MSSDTLYTRAPSPLGPLLLVGTADALSFIWLPSGRDRVDPEPEWIESARPFKEVVRQLDAYFAGRLRRFDLPLAPAGTAFQQRVWRALGEIPPGKTMSYSEIARAIGAPQAVRAVAGACASNNIAVAIPCHRVVRNDGSLSGYAWGVERKRSLIEREAQGG